MSRFANPKTRERDAEDAEDGGQSMKHVQDLPRFTLTSNSKMMKSFMSKTLLLQRLNYPAYVAINVAALVLRVVSVAFLVQHLAGGWSAEIGTLGSSYLKWALAMVFAGEGCVNLGWTAASWRQFGALLGLGFPRCNCPRGSAVVMLFFGILVVGAIAVEILVCQGVRAEFLIAEPMILTIFQVLYASSILYLIKYAGALYLLLKDLCCVVKHVAGDDDDGADIAFAAPRQLPLVRFSKQPLKTVV